MPLPRVMQRRSPRMGLCALLLSAAASLTIAATAPVGPRADAPRIAAAPPLAAKSPSQSSILITARDDLSDSNFAGSTVLVLNNIAEGPAGLIINRPMAVPVSRLFPDLKSLAGLHDKLYFGGPVDFGSSIWFLFRARTQPRHAVQACAGVYLSADADLLRQLLSRPDPMEGLRIFVGYAGWGPGQLQAEIASGAWTARRADAAGIFDPSSQRPWPPPRIPGKSTASTGST